MKIVIPQPPKKPDLIKKTDDFIKNKGLIEPRARVLIAVSGGPDSMALLSLLSELRPRWGWDLRVLHCHHGLRKEADKEESFIRDWAKSLGYHFTGRRLPVRTYQRETGKSLEEAARDLRYAVFHEVLADEGCQCVALAHTANDQAEEVLIGLIRGTGLGGLTGMALKRGPFVRPLLRATRQEILNYLAMKDIPYQEDSSNHDLRYLRARIRHHLLGELKTYSPNIIRQLNQTAGLLEKDETYLQEQAAVRAESIISYSGDTIILKRQDLGTIPQALASRIILNVLLEKMGHVRHIRSVHILSLLKAAEGPQVRGRIPLPHGWSARWDRDALTLFPLDSEPKRVESFCYEVERPGTLVIRETNEWVSFRKVEVSAGSSQESHQRNLVWIDFDSLAWPLMVRSTRPGDRFKPLGLGGSKKVNRFLIDRKVPKDLRNRIPLIWSGEEIVWIAGLEIGHSFRLTPYSTRILEITYGKVKSG